MGDTYFQAFMTGMMLGMAPLWTVLLAINGATVPAILVALLTAFFCVRAIRFDRRRGYWFR